ncbi:CinA family nicotinamide mononucleotide deamidase-related protein [Rurimicrobium arvi]|uniref:CinA-like protein n=1 Tax=Rurimicrobium arvi TaxID=2049916 RepID=A0ABP8MW91_9BACT
MNNTQAIIITIGDELLIGQIVDTNSAWIAQQLNILGISVKERIAVGDTRDAIIEALSEAIPKADLILLTGGLGPTSDDITKPVLCSFFGGKLVVNEDVLAHVTELFRKRNRPIIERNMKQAEVPDNCRVIHNPMGTAPGMLFEQNGKWIVSLPGVPFEMKAMMTETLLPDFATRFGSTQAIVHRNILTIGEGESFLAERISDLEAALPAHIRLAYLPSPMAVKLRLTGTGTDEAALTKEVEHHRDLIAARVQNRLVALEDHPIELLLANALKKQNLTIGLAESCTGGYIGHKLTQINGSSAFFKGGIISYATSAKSDILGIPAAVIEKEGVVSEAIATEMAQAARKLLHSDIGIGITGILSADPYEDKSPVGTIFISVAGPGEIRAKKYQLHYDRVQNKETATQLALYQAFEFIRPE